MRRYIGISLVLALVAGFSWTARAQESAAPQPAQPAAPESPAPEQASVAAMLADRVLGDPNAPVTIYEYSSFTCPHCASFHTEILPGLKTRYIDTGKAKLIFRDFPFDRAALTAGMLARCAPADRYWPLVDVMFKQQAQWSSAADPLAALTRIAKLAGMSQERIDACLADKELADGVLKIRLEGQEKFGVTATPTFILNEGKTRIQGAQPVETFGKAIDDLAG